MPPRAKKPTSLVELLETKPGDDAIIRTDPDMTYVSRPMPLLQVGQLVNIVNGGRTLQNYEVLAMDERFIKFRADMSVAPQTEVVLIPYAQIEALGLVGER